MSENDKTKTQTLNITKKKVVIFYFIVCKIVIKCSDY